jgi:hypothetical protein
VYQLPSYATKLMGDVDSLTPTQGHHKKVSRATFASTPFMN